MVGAVGDISSSCASSKSHCGYVFVSRHDGSSRNDPSNSPNLALQHPAQFRGPVDAQLLPGSTGDGFTSPVSPLRPSTLTNLQRWRPLPSSFLARLRRRRSQSESALRYREHPNFLVAAHDVEALAVIALGPLDGPLGGALLDVDALRPTTALARFAVFHINVAAGAARLRRSRS